MKALSLVEPWGSLIVFGHKTTELRKWNTNFRGEFLVHASRADPDPLACKKFENLSLDDNSSRIKIESK